jgi:hypothetical protein
MAMFNLSNFMPMIMPMTRVEIRVGLLKGQLIFIIKYLASFQLLRGYFLNVFPYLLRCGCQFFMYTPSLEKESLIYIR